MADWTHGRTSCPDCLSGECLEHAVAQLLSEIRAEIECPICVASGPDGARDGWTTGLQEEVDSHPDRLCEVCADAVAQEAA